MYICPLKNYYFIFCRVFVFAFLLYFTNCVHLWWIGNFKRILSRRECEKRCPNSVRADAPVMTANLRTRQGKIWASRETPRVSGLRYRGEGTDRYPVHTPLPAPVLSQGMWDCSQVQWERPLAQRRQAGYDRGAQELGRGGEGETRMEGKM